MTFLCSELSRIGGSSTPVPGYVPERFTENVSEIVVDARLIRERLL
jgi:hypothetical protein